MPCVFKKPPLQVAFRGEGGSEQAPGSRPSPAARLGTDTPALGPRNRAPAPGSLLQRRTVLLGEFLPCLLLLPPPPSLSSSPSFSRVAPVSCAGPGFNRRRESGKKKKKSPLKKKKKQPLISALFLTSAIKTWAAHWLPFAAAAAAASSSSSFLRSEPPEGCPGFNPNLAVLFARACLPCPKT